MAKYDLILSGGTVLDPANGFEGIADVGDESGDDRAGGAGA